MKLTELEKDPLTQFRAIAVNMVRTWAKDPSTATPENLTKALDALAVGFPTAKASIDSARVIAQQRIPPLIQISSPAEQLAWGLALGWEHAQIPTTDPEKPFARNHLWRTLFSHPEVEEELQINRVFALNGGANPDTTMTWGEPHSWFHFNNKTQHVNIDLMFSLITGFDNARQVVLHEIAHAEETREHPPATRRLIDQIEALEKKQATGTLTDTEYVDLAGKSTELSNRLDWNNAVEDAAANRFSIDAGERRYFQRNEEPFTRAEYILGGFRRSETPPPQQNSAAEYRTAAAVAYSGEVGYFAKPAEWEILGIKHGPDIEEINQAITGPNGIANLIAPLQLNRLQWANLRIRAETQTRLCRLRGQKIEDLWSKFMERDSQQKSQQARQSAQQAIEQAKQLGNKPPKIAIEIPEPGQDPGKPKPQPDPANRGVPIKIVLSGGRKAKGGSLHEPGTEQIAAQAGKADAWLDDLPVGDLKHYAACKEQWAGAIAIARRMVKRIQDAQVQMKPRPAQAYSVLPEDADIADRLDTQKLQDFRALQETGARVAQDDRKLFREDVQQSEPTNINMIFAVDGSGSMAGPAIQKAMQTALIFYEATRGSAVNTWIVVWGPKNPPIIASPTSKTEDIQQAIDGVMTAQGINSGTELTPALKTVTEAVAQHKSPPDKMVGYTHLFIASDGDIFDPEPAHAALHAIERTWPKFTTDVLVIANHNHETGIEQIGTNLKRFMAAREIENGGAEMLYSCLGRVKAARSFAAATPAYQEAIRAKKALAAINLTTPLETRSI